MRGENSGRDWELDAALAKYTAVEPRPGLEQRILANLRAERRPQAAPGWRGWALAALTGVISIAIVSTSWRTRNKAFNTSTTLGSASRKDVADHSGSAVAAQNNIGRHASESGRSSESVQSTRRAKGALANRLAAHVLPLREATAEPAPRLGQFPAPQPLSEQEKLLVRFAEDHPWEAALVAEARAEQLHSEDEEMKEFIERAGRVQQER